MTTSGNIFKSIIVAFATLLLVGCADQYPDAPTDVPEVTTAPDYVIGAGDDLSIYVWRNPDLSSEISVRPDGRISIPLVEDMQAAGKTPTELGRDIEKTLGQYVQDPSVTVIVKNFIGPYSEQIRIVGEAAAPSAVPYRERMTILDAMIEVGGLTEFAAGNRAVIVRRGEGGEEKVYRVRLDDLLKGGDVSANVDLLPGDVVIIPQSWF